MEHIDIADPSVWREVAAGRLSWEAVGAATEARQKRRDAALRAVARRPEVRPRPAPAPSRQYAPAMPTTAARDRRITANALRVLVLVLALAGPGDEARTTKARIAGALGLHPKAVQKLLAALERAGYIARRTWTDEKTGRDKGVIVTVLATARPFWHGRGAAVLPLVTRRGSEESGKSVDGCAAAASVLRPVDPAPESRHPPRRPGEDKPCR